MNLYNMHTIKTTKKIDLKPLIVFSLVFFLNACGQIGPLYLPDTLKKTANSDAHYEPLPL